MAVNPAIIAALVQAAGSIGGGLLGSSGNKETKVQKQQRKTIDEILSSISGEGAFSNLFNADEDAFQQSVVNPLMSQFHNVVAPGIQQEFVNAGLHRGTGLDDALSRAGIDLQSNIQQAFLPFLESGQNRGLSALQSVLGAGTGAPRPLTTSQALGQSTSGFLSSQSGEKSFEKLLDLFTQRQKKTTDQQTRKASNFNPAGFVDITELLGG